MLFKSVTRRPFLAASATAGLAMALFWHEIDPAEARRRKRRKLARTVPPVVSANAFAAVKARANPVSAAPLILSDRPSARWVPVRDGVPPVELEDLAWFRDAGGTAWVMQDGALDIRAFGARGDGVSDDSRAIFAAAVWATLGHCKHLWFDGGTWLVADGWLMWMPDGAKKQALMAIQGASGDNCGIPFIGTEGLLIEGRNGARIKRRAAGCSTNSRQQMSWGMFNFKACRNTRITGLTFDGNRMEQTHTLGERGTNTNFGVFVMGDCHNFRIDACHFTGSGTMTSDSDKSGDDIYFRNGVKYPLVEKCRFSGPGRWAVTLERPEPRFTDDETTRSRGGIIRNCQFDLGFRADGAVQLGSIDLEPWSPYEDWLIENNSFKGSCRISLGSAPNSARQVIRNIVIRNNVFDCRGTGGASERPGIIMVSSAWSRPAQKMERSERIYDGLVIEGNRFLSDQPFGGDIIQFLRAGFRNTRIANNVVQVGVAGPGSFLRLSEAAIEGSFVVEGNQTGAMAQGFWLQSWAQLESRRPADIAVRRNDASRATWGVRGTVPELPEGSRIVFEGNALGKVGGRNQLDTRAFRARGGQVSMAASNRVGGAARAIPDSE